MHPAIVLGITGVSAPIDRCVVFAIEFLKSLLVTILPGVEFELGGHSLIAQQHTRFTKQFHHIM